MIHLFQVAIAIVFAASSRLYAYTLEEYKQDVSKGDSSYQALTLKQQAAEIDLRRPEALSAVQIFSTNYYMHDTRSPLNSTFMGDDTKQWELSLGLKQRNPLGFEWSLAETFRHTDVRGFSLAPGSYKFFESAPKLELRVPLWRNAFGRELEAQISALTYGTRIQKLQSQIALVKKEIEIEERFFQYAIQLHLSALAEKNMQRSERLYNSIRSKRSRNLVDASDESQTRAVWALRKLEHTNSIKTLETKKNNFNSLLGDLTLPSKTTTDLKIDPLSSEQLNSVAAKDKVSLYEKVKTLDIKYQQSQTLAEYESAKPDLNLFSSVTFQGRDNNKSGAYSELIDKKENSWMVGISLQTPFDIGLSRDLMRAARLKESASEELLKREDLEQKISWVQFKQDLTLCSENLPLFKDIEDSQTKRLASEESKYRNGRSTLFIVLSAEQDLISAQAQRWTYELQCRLLHSNAKLFVDTKDI